MTLTKVRQQLHEYIDHADEKKIKAIYTLLESDIEDTGHAYDVTTLHMLEERRTEYLRGDVKGMTVTESMEFVKKEMEGRGI